MNNYTKLKLRLRVKLPRTRTGKIVRRLIKAKILHADLGDLSNLENPESVNALDKAL